jgi:hypothetical protein
LKNLVDHIGIATFFLHNDFQFRIAVHQDYDGCDNLAKEIFIHLFPIIEGTVENFFNPYLDQSTNNFYIRAHEMD